MLFCVHIISTSPFMINCCFCDDTFAPRCFSASLVPTHCLRQFPRSVILWRIFFHLATAEFVLLTTPGKCWKPLRHEAEDFLIAEAPMTEAPAIQNLKFVTHAGAGTPIGEEGEGRTVIPEHYPVVVIVSKIQLTGERIPLFGNSRESLSACEKQYFLINQQLHLLFTCRSKLTSFTDDSKILHATNSHI